MNAIENEICRIAPLGASDLQQYEELAGEIYQLLSDEHTLHSCPRKS